MCWDGNNFPSVVPFSSQQLLHNLSRNVSKVYNTAIQKKVHFYGKNYMKRVRISIFLLDSNKFFIRIQALDPILTNLREKEQLNKTKLNFWKRIFVHGKIKYCSTYCILYTVPVSLKQVWGL